MAIHVCEESMTSTQLTLITIYYLQDDLASNQSTITSTTQDADAVSSCFPRGLRRSFVVRAEIRTLSKGLQ